MNKPAYRVKIGDWSLLIEFDPEVSPSKMLLSGLSFLVEPALHNIDEKDPKIQIQHLKNPIPTSCIRINKQDRHIHWNNGLRIVTGPRFQFQVLVPFTKAAISAPVADEDFADLLESWVGFHYERTRGVRLHALATKDFVVVAPSGFGKTHYALANISRLVADEVVFIRGGQIENWYSALRIKEPGSWICRHGPRRILGIPTHPQPQPPFHLGQCSAWSILFGLGLPQHLEFSLFITSPQGWLCIGLRRARFILKNRLAFMKPISREYLYSKYQPK